MSDEQQQPAIMERGAREPRATMILRLAQGLEVPPGALLDELEVDGA